MQPITILSAPEQVAEHLRVEILRGGFSGTLPGVNSMVADLGVNHKTVKTALRLLEDEGMLVNQGRGRKRLIVLPNGYDLPVLRVGFLFYEKGDETHDLLTKFQNKLKAEGLLVHHGTRYQLDIGGDMRLLARVIRDTEVDAWVVCSGSKMVLQSFVQWGIPAFAIFGLQSDLNIPGAWPNQVPAIVAATRRLVALGHQRIVLLDGETTLREPGRNGIAFLEELTAHGIETGKYNMPGWVGGLEGFYRCLKSLFERTPPTAIFIYSATQYVATTQFLINRGLQVPQDVSLVCIDQAPYFKRLQPSIAHVIWNNNVMVNRILRWANEISHGKEDFKQTVIKAEFIEGGTIGPVPKG